MGTQHLKLTLLSCILTSTILTGCETQEDRALESARACTDSAGRMAFSDPDSAATMAQSCETNLTSSGISGSEVNKIKFGLILLKEKKLSKIAEMATAAKTNSGSVDGMNSAFSVMVFTVGGLTQATTFETLGNSIGGGAQLIGNVVATATRLNSIIPFSTTDASAFKDALTQCASTCTNDEKVALATSVISSVSAACSSADDNSNSMCSKLRSMTGGTIDTQTLLNNMSTYLAQTH